MPNAPAEAPVGLVPVPRSPVRVAVALLAGFALLLLPASPHGAQAQERSVTLEEAVRAALADSREIRDARLEVEAARGQLSEARGFLYPRLDLSLRYTRNVTPPSTFLPTILFDPDAPMDDLTRIRFGADNVWTSALVLEQPVLEARAMAGLGVATRLVDLQEERLREREHEVATRVRSLYYDLLLAREEERLMANSLARVRSSLAQTRALQEEGLASEYEVLRLEVEAANLEPAVDRARNAQREAARELSVAMGGEALADEIEAVGSLAEMDLADLAANTPENRAILAFMGPDPADVGEDRLLEEARVGRSALRQAELDGRRHRAQLRAERADRLPRLSLFASYDVQAQQDGRLDFFGESGQRGYGRTVGFQVSVPIFTGFQRGARVEQARAQLRRAETRQEELIERTNAEVRTVVERVEEARTRTRAQARAVEQARRGYRMVRAQFEQGLASQLELTDAEVALRQSEVNYAEAVHAYLSARARLDALVGQMPGEPRT